MPELPEVEALADFLRTNAVGAFIARIDVAAFTVLKTYQPPTSALHGAEITGVRRFGKFLAVDVSGTWLVTHLSRAGWLHWREILPTAPPKPGKGPLALRIHLAGGSGWDLTEAGTQKRLACYLVADPLEVSGIARLGPDALDPALTDTAFRERLAGRSGQVKKMITDQTVVAGIGNAYSDEILHAARMSPFAQVSGLSEKKIDELYGAMVATLRNATQHSVGRKVAQLKAEKRSGLQVHARGGLPCPVCGDTVRDVSFADTSWQYCPTCQTNGKVLADRRHSRLLK